jgi:serine/threonine protein kinase
VEVSVETWNAYLPIHCLFSIGCLLFQCLTGRTPFDEASLCRLFLHCAGANFDGYEMPDLPADTEPTLGALIRSLLQIDRTKRTTPRQLLEAAEAQFESVVPR